MFDKDVVRQMGTETGTTPYANHVTFGDVPYSPFKPVSWSSLNTFFVSQIVLGGWDNRYSLDVVSIIFKQYRPPLKQC